MNCNAAFEVLLTGDDHSSRNAGGVRVLDRVGDCFCDYKQDRHCDIRRHRAALERTRQELDTCAGRCRAFKGSARLLQERGEIYRAILIPSFADRFGCSASSSGHGRSVDKYWLKNTVIIARLKVYFS
jgi:hypothetical protein